MTEGAPPPPSGASRAASLAVWDIPAAVVAGEHFAVKAGVRSAAGCGLGGCRVEILDGADRAIASGALGASPWPGTDALYWTEIELCAPSVPGTAALSARFAGTDAAEPHEAASSCFGVSVVGAPEHVVTVTVGAEDGPVADAIVRAGPIRVITDARGRARLHLAKGHHELVVWKAGYEAEPVPLALERDMAVSVAARALPEENPDAHWTA